MVRRATALSRDRGPSQRQLQVGESVRHALCEVLGRDLLRDPDLVGQSITVSEVRVSPDMRHATAFVLPLGGDEVDTVLAGLRRAAPYLSTQVGQLIHLKRTPRLAFERDSSFDRASEIDAVLRRPEVARDLAPRQTPEDGGAGERDDG